MALPGEGGLARQVMTGLADLGFGKSGAVWGRALIR